jgi:membrane protease YdiL (CAAX protease family)
LLPLLIASATGSVLLAFVAATLVFGLIHLYQGWVGVLATTALGALLGLFYLVTESLLVAIAVHVLIDLNGLVVDPIVSGAWRR